MKLSFTMQLDFQRLEIFLIEHESNLTSACSGIIKIWLAFTITSIY